MAPKTIAERLEEIDIAIEAVETRGQSYTTGDGRSYTRANVSELYAERRRLRADQAQEVEGGQRAGIEFGGAC